MAAVDAGTRLLVLTRVLADTQIGHTRDTLRSMVPGYEGLSDDAFLRAFERDIKMLRDLGMFVETRGELETPRYRLGAESRSDQRVTFSPTEAGLLADAAGAWDSEADGAALLARLSIFANESLQGTVKTRLEGSGIVPTLFYAVARHHPVAFTYASRKGVEHRDVTPWRLLAHGRALYLWGFDLNRWAERLFRVGRIQGDVNLIGEAGEDGPGPQARPPDIFRIAPILMVRRDVAPLVRNMCTLIEPVDQEWDRCQGKNSDSALWERLILENASDVVVLGPPELRERLLRIINASRGEEHGTQ
ncbi:WYL domain-containing protein [Actinomycetaceae bacterium WB03_NA08]|uniref:WYL domain-containing protein n=1 Tax=Scrofimicrobium canadense TaxID=2652290 RepID=A0A6N7VQ84_9ACTO|nr:WYL domain-containing protein [Scrofimicrobium canadense]MSS83904.1 WYL domain-containing protein [Scrofimicrobium canadense]